MQAKSAGNPLFLRDAVLDDSLELLLRAHLTLISLAIDHLSAEKLDQTDFFVLFFVARHPSITSTELGRLVGQSKQNLSRHVNGLIDRNLLVRDRDEHDQRRQLLHTTEMANRLVDEVVTGQRRRLRRAFRDIGPDAVDGFRAIVEALVQVPQRRPAPLSDWNNFE